MPNFANASSYQKLLANPITSNINPPISSGSSITLTAHASGGGTTFYQYFWYTSSKEGECSDSYTPITKCNTYQTCTVTPSSSTYYCYIVTATTGSNPGIQQVANSFTYYVQVEPISVSVTPSSQTFTSGTQITLTACVIGVPSSYTSYTYQWYNYTSITPVAISGASAATFTEIAGATPQTVKYQVEVKGSLGDIYSSVYSYTIINPNPTPPPSPPSPPQQQSSNCGLLPASISAQVTSQAPWYCPINEQIYDAWKSYIPAVLIVILLAFSIAALIYLIGVLVNRENIKRFALGEFYEAIASTIIAAAFLYICAVLFGLIPAYVVGTVNPYATAFHLIFMVINAAETLFNSLYQLVLPISAFSSLYVTLTVPIPGATSITSNLFIPQIAYLADILVTEPAEVLSSFVIEGMIALYSEYYLLLFFAIYAIPIFLIPGVILRALMPTRALGGAMIAVAMGFYLIMPTLFAIAFYFTVPQTFKTISLGAIAITRDTAQGLPSTLSASTPLVSDLNQMQVAMSDFWLLILFYPLLIIAVTYTFIVEMSNFIGGAQQRMGRLRGFI
ncbi:MAG: hypothetical protein QXY21_01750 [Candidatus Micrarchaeaceae archaeon]